MDRLIVFPGAIPLDSDSLNAQKDAYYGLGWLAQALLGTSTAVVGLAVTPTAPASLQVNVAPGAIFAQATVDSSAYGSLGTDANQIVKQGLSPTTQTLTLTPPSTSGYSTNYLVEVGFSEVDDTPVTLPYYNASDPSVAWLGPNNSGNPQNTRRHDNCVISLKAGTPAPTGSQTTPSPDAGYVGLYVVTVANGQTQIVSGNISLLANAPLIATTLPEVPGSSLANAWSYGADTGTTNALSVTLSPAPAAYAAGMEVQVKAANTTTGAATINVNGLGAVPIVHKDGTPLASGDITGGQIAFLAYDGAHFQLQAATGTAQFTIPYAVDSGSANAIVAAYTPAITAYTPGLLLEVKVAATNTGATTINVNGLGNKTIKTSTGADLSAGAITAGQVIFVVFDGTNFQLGLTLSGAYGGLPYAPDTGTANALVATFSPAISSLSAGLAIQVKVANTNTGATTINVNGLGNTSVIRSSLAALQGGDLVAGEMVTLVYDGAHFQFGGARVITNADVAQMAAGTIKANLTGSAAAPTDSALATVAAALGVIGVGQTWQTPGRSGGTAYQNTSGRPIEVKVVVAMNSNQSAAFGVGASSIATTIDNVAAGGGAATVASIGGIVPSGWYYQVTLTGATINSWAELR